MASSALAVDITWDPRKSVEENMKSQRLSVEQCSPRDTRIVYDNDLKENVLQVIVNANTRDGNDCSNRKQKNYQRVEGKVTASRKNDGTVLKVTEKGAVIDYDWWFKLSSGVRNTESRFYSIFQIKQHCEDNKSNKLCYKPSMSLKVNENGYFTIQSGTGIWKGTKNVAKIVREQWINAKMTIDYSSNGSMNLALYDQRGRPLDDDITIRGAWWGQAGMRTKESRPKFGIYKHNVKSNRDQIVSFGPFSINYGRRGVIPTPKQPVQPPTLPPTRPPTLPPVQPPTVPKPPVFPPSTPPTKPPTLPPTPPTLPPVPPTTPETSLARFGPGQTGKKIKNAYPKFKGLTLEGCAAECLVYGQSFNYDPSTGACTINSGDSSDSTVSGSGVFTLYELKK
eukprot:Awhi_evm1s15746